MSAYHFLASSFVGTRLEFSTAASFWLLRYIPLLYAFLHTSNGFPHIDLSLSDGKTLLSPHTLGKVCDHHSSTLFSLTFWSHFLFWQNFIVKKLIFSNVKIEPSDMRQSRHVSFYWFKKKFWPNSFMTPLELRSYPNGKKIDMKNSILALFFHIKFFLERKVGLQCFSRNWKNQHLTNLQHYYEIPF